MFCQSTMNPTSIPRSAFDQTGGLFYFARMLDKIRLHAQGTLRADFHGNLGKFGDEWCAGFLRVDYAAIRERTLDGGSDDEILEWCYEHGRRLNGLDIFIWNQFTSKLGWNDKAAAQLALLKQQSGLADRDDIQTMAQFFEVDEGRKP